MYLYSGLVMCGCTDLCIMYSLEDFHHVLDNGDVS